MATKEATMRLDGAEPALRTAGTPAPPARGPHDASSDADGRGASAVRRAGLRKAAIFLMTIEEDTAAEVFKRLSDVEATVLGQEIIRLGFVGDDEIDEVVAELEGIFAVAGTAREGGTEQAFDLLRRSFPPDTADRIIESLAEGARPQPFEFLASAETESLLPYLQEEHPQTIALVLSHLPPQKAAEIIDRLPKLRQSDIVRRIATIGSPSPEAIRQVEAGFKKHLASLPVGGRREVGGVDTCAEILDRLDRGAERTVLEALERADGPLVDEIQRRRLVFQDIACLDDRDIRAVLDEVDDRRLAMALKSAPVEVKDKLLRNLSQRAASVREEIDLLGPVRRADVQEAQQAILEIARHLDAPNGGAIAGGGGEGGCRG